MSTVARLAVRLFSALMRLYPRSLRQEFGDEMLAVYTEAVEEARARSRRDLLVTMMRELRDFPSFLLREHWRNLSKLEPKLMTLNSRPTRIFYPAWIILTALCIPLALGLGYAILRGIVLFAGERIHLNGVEHLTEDFLFGYVFAPTTGLLVGLAQFVLLRRYLPRMGWWVLTTAGGWALGLLLILPGLLTALTDIWGAESIYETWAYVLGFSLLGLSVGFGQWLVLRGRLPTAGWWIGANVLGFGLLGLMAGDALGQYFYAFGLLPAAVTAATLAFLMKPATPTAT